MDRLLTLLKGSGKRGALAVRALRRPTWSERWHNRTENVVPSRMPGRARRPESALTCRKLIGGRLIRTVDLTLIRGAL